MPDLDGNYKAEEDENVEEKDFEHDEEETGEGERPAGTRTMEDSTGINPDEVDAIDEDMPPMPPA